MAKKKKKELLTPEEIISGAKNSKVSNLASIGNAVNTAQNVAKQILEPNGSAIKTAQNVGNAINQNTTKKQNVSYNTNNNIVYETQPIKRETKAIKPTIMTPQEIVSSENIQKQQQSINKAQQKAKEDKSESNSLFSKLLNLNKAGVKAGSKAIAPTAANSLKIFGKGAMKAEEGMFIDAPLGMSSAFYDTTAKVTNKAGNILQNTFGPNAISNYILNESNKVSNLANQMASTAAEDWTSNSLDYFGWNKKLSNGKTITETIEDKSIIKENSLVGQAIEATGGMAPSILMGMLGTDIAGLTTNGQITNMANVTPAVLSRIKNIQSALSYSSLGAKAYGGGFEQAINEGGTIQQANNYGLLNAAVEIGTEWLTGGVPGLKRTMGSGLDGLFGKYILKEGIEETSKSLGKAIIKAFWKNTGEMFEEQLAEFLSPYVKQFTYQYDENKSWGGNFKQATNNISFEDITKAGIVGFFTSLLLGGADIGDIKAGYQNSQAINKTINEQISLQENMLGRELTKEETNTIKQQVNEEANRMYEQQKAIDEERLKQNKFRFSEQEAKNIKSDNQNVLANEAYRLDNTEDNHKIYNITNAVQGVNNTHQYHLTTNEGLYQMGIINKNANGEYTMPDGSPYVPRGLTTIGNDIYINTDVGSQSGTQAMYHEMLESFKNTSETEYNQFKQMIKDIVGEETIQNEIAKYQEMYGDKTTNIEDEIINDKFGELAENQNFINKIADNRNVLEKFIDSIKNMIKYVKGTDQERQLMKLQKNLEKEFAKRYKETDFSQGEGDTAYSLGKHYGDLGKGNDTYYGHMYDSRRSTGHFGTGTYFVGEDYQPGEHSSYANRPVQKVEFDDYNNLFKPANRDAGFDLHDGLKEVNYNNTPISKELYDKLLPYYEASFNSYNELLDEDYDNDYKNVRNLLEEAGVETEEPQNYYDSGKGQYGKTYEKYLEDEITEVLNNYDRYQKAERDLKRVLGITDEQYNEAIEKVRQAEKEYEKHSYDQKLKDDSLSTVFMKTLGYNGVDVRGLEGLDDTTYGSVIYDLDNKTNNISYSLTSNKDSQGRELSKQQQEYFKDSKVVDENGNLLVLNHATPDNSFTVFNKQKIGKNANGSFNQGGELGRGFYFSDEQSAYNVWNNWVEEQTGKPSQSMKVYLNIKNPFYYNNELNQDALNYLKEHNANYLDRVNNNKKIINIAKLNNIDIQNMLKELGYDGIIDGSFQIVAFESNQIKNIDNTNPTSNEDIRYSLTTNKDSNGRTLSEGQQEYFKNSKVVDENGNLLLMHNGRYSNDTIFKPSRWTNEKNGPTQIKGYFATDKSYSDIYGDVSEYYLDIKNPLEMRFDNGMEYGTLEEWQQFFKEHGVTGVEFDSSLYDVNTKGQYLDENGNYNKNAPKRYLPFEIVDSDEYWSGDGNVTERIKAAGYDGLTWTEGGKSYMPFESNAIKQISNLNPTSNEDIRYSLEKNNKQEDIAPTKGYVEEYKPQRNENEGYNALTEEDANLYQETLTQDEDYLRSLEESANIENNNNKSINKITNLVNGELGLDYIGKNKIENVVRNAIENNLTADEISEALFNEFKDTDVEIEDFDNIADYMRNAILNDMYNTQMEGQASLDKEIQFNMTEDIAPTTIRSQESIDNFIENRDIAPVRETKPYANKNRTETREKLKNMARQAREMFENRNAVIDDISKITGNKEIKFTGDNLNNVTSEAEYNINQNQTDINGKWLGKGVKQLFEPARSEGLYEAFNDYLFNKSNIERHAVNKGSQVPLQVSKQLVAQYELNYPQFKEWSKDISKYFDNSLQEEVDAGLITQDLYEKLRGENGMYRSYVPFYADTDYVQSRYLDNEGNLKPVNPLKRAKGGASDVSKLLSIEDAMARQTYAVKKAIRQNELYRELVNSMEKYDNMMNEDIRSNPTDLVDSLFVTPEGDKILTAYVNGEKVSAKITDELYNELMKTNENNIRQFEENFSVITKPLQKISNIRRNVLTTWNPAFLARNAIKDIQDAVINSKHTTDMLANYYGLKKGQKASIIELAQAKTTEAQQFLALYGADNTYGNYANLSKGKNIANKFTRLNELVELAPRFAEFKASLQNGESVNEAIYNAREVTTNFGRGGYITKALNRNGFTFLNANVQGLSKAIRNLTGQNGVKGVVSMVIKGAAFSVLPSLLNHLLYGLDDDKDEEYEALPDYIKDNYYLIKLNNGKFFRIPKGRITAVFGSLARRTSETIEGEENAFEGWAKNAWDQIGVGSLGGNNILAPLNQAKLFDKSSPGEAWYGGDIVPTRLQKKPQAEQTDSKIDAISNFIGEKTNISPYKINYVLDQYSGALGDIFLPMITPETTNGAETPVDYLTAPIKDAFVVNSTDDNKYAGEFYTMKDKLEIQNNSDYATDEDKLRYKYISNISTQMSALYKEKREVQGDTTLSNSEKYAKVQAIQNEINSLAREGIKNYNNVTATSNYASVNDLEYYKDTEGKWQKVGESDAEFTAGLTTTEKDSYYYTKNKISEIDSTYKKNTENLKDNSALKNQYSMKRKADITQAIINSGLDDYTKAMIYSKHYSTREKMTNAYNAGYNINEYMKAMYDIEAIRDKYSQKKGYTTAQRKQKTIAYINSLNMNIPQKAMIVRQYYSSFRSYNNSIINYVNNIDISYEDKVSILQDTGMKVNGNRVTWK